MKFNDAANEFVKSNTFMAAMKNENNFKCTENGATAKSSTLSKVYDLFALGGAYRKRSDEDCILLFKEAYEEDKNYALKCLWYLRDIEQGQGERRFFRVCLKWLATHDTDAVIRNLSTIVDDGFGRWDDLFMLFDTPAESAMMRLVQKQLIEDIKAYKVKNGAVSLCAKWMPSINASSRDTVTMAQRFIKEFDVTPAVYRKTLSGLRERLHVVERLMSQNRWSEIDFSHLPSRAGLLYRNAFKRRDLIAEKYKEFAHSDEKVNAGTLYPYDVVAAAQKVMNCSYCYSRPFVPLDDTERLMVNKYWENLKNYFDGGISNMMVVCDTSGSMTSGYSNSSIAPIDVAVSLALYAAERAKGPFANHYISFSRVAKLIETRGVDFCDKVDRVVRANLCENTNLESVFDLVLDTAMRNRVRPEDIPSTLVIVTDMEVDRCSDMRGDKTVFMETIRRKWQRKCGGKYKFPNLVYWNVDARNSTFLDDPKSGVTFVSGASPVLFEQVLKGLSGIQLMLNKLNSDRYKSIQ